LLLLALRVAVLLLLALALARPSTFAARDGTGQGDAIDAVLVLDTSYSMAARDGVLPLRDVKKDPDLLALHRVADNDDTLTGLDGARAAALAVIDQLPPHSTVQVITWTNQEVRVGPEVATRLDQARALVEDVQVTSLATDLSPGLREAVAALRRGHAPNKELY